MKKIIVLLIIAFSVNLSFSTTNEYSSKDFLVSINNDTIYGKIEWKSNSTVYIINQKGKQKFRADKAKFFQRGAFRYVSIKTMFPEYLLEIVNGPLSLYKESHLKSRTVDRNYKKSVYITYEDKLYTFNYPIREWGKNSFEFYSSNLKLEFTKIVGENSPLIKLIENKNVSIKDLEHLVNITNKMIENDFKFDKTIIDLPKRYAQGYIINQNNDKILGAIKVNKNFLFTNTITFLDLNNNQYDFKSKDLIEFKVNNRIYINEILKNKKETLSQIIKGKISLYQNIKDSKFYLKKDDENFVLVDKKYKFLSIFKDNEDLYLRIKKNEYKRFEIKSMIRLYNNVP
jgi:hypothetical protein